MKQNQAHLSHIQCVKALVVDEIEIFEEPSILDQHQNPEVERLNRREGQRLEKRVR